MNRIKDVAEMVANIIAVLPEGSSNDDIANEFRLTHPEVNIDRITDKIGMKINRTQPVTLTRMIRPHHRG